MAHGKLRPVPRSELWESKEDARIALLAVAEAGTGTPTPEGIAAMELVIQEVRQTLGAQAHTPPPERPHLVS